MRLPACLAAAILPVLLVAAAARAADAPPTPLPAAPQAPLPAMAPAPAQGQSSDPLAATYRLLATRIDIVGGEKTGGALVADLEKKVPGLKIVIDPSVREAGFDLSEAKFDGLGLCRGIPVREVLDQVVQPLVWVAEADGVRIMTLEKYIGPPSPVVFLPPPRARPGPGSLLGVESRPRWVLPATMPPALSRVTYPVGRLLALSRQSASGKERRWTGWSDSPWQTLGPEQLVDTIQRFVSSQHEADGAADRYVAEWMDVGGQALIDIEGGELVVRQTAEGHRQTAELLTIISRNLGVEYTGPAPRPIPREEALLVEETRRLLAKPIDVDFEDVGLDKVLEYLGSEVPGLNMLICRDVAEGGLDLSTQRITLKVRSLPLGMVLNHCLGRHLAYVAKPGYVLITTREQAQLNLPLVVYPLYEQRWGNVSSGGRWTGNWSPEQVVDIIKRNVSAATCPTVAAWADEGGPAGIDFTGGFLLVTQSSEGHARVARLLALMRAAGTVACEMSAVQRGPVPMIVEYRDPPELAAMRKALDERIDVDFHDTPIASALETVAARPTWLNIVPDKDCQLADTHITLKRQGATREEVIRELFVTSNRDQPACVVHPDYVEVTTRDRAEYATLRLAAHQMCGLAGGGQSFGIHMIKLVVRHETDLQVATWADEGGSGSIDVPGGGFLLILQTPRGHERISVFLEALRQQRAAESRPRVP